MIEYNYLMDIRIAALSLVILVFSAIIHEITHGFVAYRLGDPTAKLMGRLTLDPRKHIDPVFTILLPILTFISSGGSVMLGGAKPVPVDPFNLRDGRKDMALVSLAGPLVNILIAIVSSFLFHLLNTAAVYSLAGISFLLPAILLILQLFAYYNLLLAIFNLLPIPPLDGSKVFSLLLPDREAAAYLGLGQIGILILFLLLLFPFGGFSLSNLIGTIFTYGLHLLGLPLF